MSDSGTDRPLAPRRSLHKSPTSIDEPTPPMGVSTYAGDAQQRRSAAQVPPQVGGATSPSAYAEPAESPPPSPPAKQRAAPQATASRAPAVRRARLRMVRIDPWSVTKTAFLLSIAFGITCVVAVFLIMSVMTAAGLWDHINQSIQGVLNQDPADAFDINSYVSTRRVLGLTMLVAALDVVLITALATLAAFLYNMAASLLGGIEVTLAEDARR